MSSNWRNKSVRVNMEISYSLKWKWQHLVQIITVRFRLSFECDVKTALLRIVYETKVHNNKEYSFRYLGTSLCVLDSMCPCLYVSISLCVQGSMWQISCRIDPLWLWFYVSRVLCGPGSMWPLMYKLTLCVVGPMCPGSNVTNALCVHGSMWP